jgi:hypothetical protein
VRVIAFGAVECADIEAERSGRNARQVHPCIAFWAMRLLAGDERATGRGITFRHQPYNACPSNQPSFLESARSDAAASLSELVLAPWQRPGVTQNVTPLLDDVRDSVARMEKHWPEVDMGRQDMRFRF